MFLLCVAYVRVRLCYSSDLPRHVKIATPTALSSRALKPGFSVSGAITLSICKGLIPPEALRLRHVLAAVTAEDRSHSNQ